MLVIKLVKYWRFLFKMYAKAIGPKQNLQFRLKKKKKKLIFWHQYLSMKQYTKVFWLNWRKKVQNIKKFDISVTKLVKLWKFLS